MDGLLRCHSRGGRPTTRPVPPDEAAREGACQPGRLPVYGLEPVHQLDPGPRRALVPGRRGPRAQDSSLHTLERGRNGHAGEHTRSRHRRAPLDLCELSVSLRSRLQPLLPGQGQRHGRRPGVLPGSRVTRHLCPRVRRGPARGRRAGQLPFRSRRQGLVQLPAPSPHARLVGVPDGVDGAWPPDGHLPGALQSLPRAPRAR